jgi:hypothetical protein
LATAIQRHGSDCSAACGGIINAEADLLDNDWFDVMNRVTKDAIAEVKTTTPVPLQTVNIEFIDVTSYLTVGSCSKHGRHLNGLYDGLPLSAFHPTQLGYDEYYRALKDNLAR